MFKQKKLVPVLIIVSVAILYLPVFGCHSSGTQSKDSGTQKEDENPDGFVPIFDGKTLNGWKGDTAYWHVKNGVIVGQETEATAPLLKANTFLIWEGGQPSNFVLEAEYKISSGGNSGIQYRSEKVEGVPFGLKGYQLDMDGANTYTGQNYEERGRTIIAFRGQKVTLPPVSGPVSEYAKGNIWRASVVTDTLADLDSLKSLIKDGWNKVRIVAQGNHLQHYINGVLMCDVTDNDTANRKAKGLIGLQLHAGHVMKIEFRNIEIKKL